MYDIRDVYISENTMLKQNKVVEISKADIGVSFFEPDCFKVSSLFLLLFDAHC